MVVLESIQKKDIVCTYFGTLDLTMLNQVQIFFADLNVDERHPGLDGEDPSDEHVVQPEEVGGLGGQTGGNQLPDGGHSQDVSQSPAKRGEIVSLVILKSHSVFPISFHNRVVPNIALNHY